MDKPFTTCVKMILESFEFFVVIMNNIGLDNFMNGF